MLSPTSRPVLVVLAMLLLAVSACEQYGRGGPQGRRGGDAGSGDDPSWVDSDGDGLSDSQEEDLGTDPDDADTDGDGWEDETEVESSTNPLDGGDHPYEQGWPIDSCRDGVVSTGSQIGQITDNFELLSQTGEMVRLHDFCDRAVLLITAAFW